MDFVIRIILCFIFPPLAVFDKGCGTILLICVLTLIGWLPGTVVALILWLCRQEQDRNFKMSEKDQKLRVSGGDLLILILRYILCLVFLPLAVVDKGCGTILIVFLLTLAGWLPGTIMALLICIKDKNYYIKSQK